MVLCWRSCVLCVVSFENNSVNSSVFRTISSWRRNRRSWCGGGRVLKWWWRVDEVLVVGCVCKRKIITQK